MVEAMIATVAAVLTVAAAGPLLARRMAPRWAVWLLGVALIAAAACGVFVLGVVTSLWLGQIGEVAAQGRWSAASLRALDPISREISIAAGLVLIPVGVWTLRTLVRHIRQLIAFHRIERDLPEEQDAITVVPSADLNAFTLPSGRVLITEGLLGALSPSEREIVLAHERSHRAHQHTWWKLVVDLAAAVNPLLRRTANVIGDMTERWADEDATQVADRRSVALTIGRVALLRSGREPAGSAASAGGQVPQRVRALLEPPPRTRPRHVLAVLLLVITLGATTVAVERAGETVFENAMRHRIHAATTPHSTSLVAQSRPSGH